MLAASLPKASEYKLHADVLNPNTFLFIYIYSKLVAPWLNMLLK